MIYEFEKVQVKTFVEGKDSYGQVRKGNSTTRQVEMIIKNYQRVNVQDIRYVDATDIGLTKDDQITDQNQIISSTGVYNVLFTIPSKRFNQVFLKRVG